MRLPKIIGRAIAIYALLESCIEVSEASVDSDRDVIEKWRSFERLNEKVSVKLFETLEPLIDVEGNVSRACLHSLQEMLLGIRRSKLWAFQMVDAFGKLPHGLLSGTTTALGDYDLCLGTRAPRGAFRGRYCSVDIRPPLGHIPLWTKMFDTIPVFENFTDPSTVTWKFVRNAWAFRIVSFRTAVCVPSTCDEKDISEIVGRVLQNIELDFEWNVSHCETDESVPLSGTEIIIICMLGFVCILVTAATACDVMLHRCHRGALTFSTRCLLSFSIVKNTQRLLSKDNSPDTIRVFHGMRVFTLLWIFLGHIYFFNNWQSWSGQWVVQSWLPVFIFQAVFNAILSVDTFFFMMGVLVVYVTTSTKKELNVFAYILYRLWRLTPPMMFLLGVAMLLPRLGSGPLWHDTVENGLVRQCRNTWWINLLYGTNFIPGSQMCLLWTWYIAADTQLYVVALIFLIPLKRRPRLAFFLNGLLLITGLITPLVNSIVYRLPPAFLVIYNYLGDGLRFGEKGYFRSDIHLPPLCVGLAVGYYLASRPKLTLSRRAKLLGWTASSLISFGALFGVHRWNSGVEPEFLTGLLYCCTNKLAWSLALAWVVVADYTGNAGVATSILKWEGLVPLSRLTFSTYLVHGLVQFVYVGSTRALFPTRHSTFFFMYLCYVVTAYLCGYLFCMLFEAPFTGLKKIVLSKSDVDELRDRNSNTANSEIANTTVA